MNLTFDRFPPCDNTSGEAEGFLRLLLKATLDMDNGIALPVPDTLQVTLV